MAVAENNENLIFYIFVIKKIYLWEKSISVDI